MSCYHPMARFEREDGKVFIEKYISESTENFIEWADKNKHMSGYKRADVIPCGQCIGCRLDYSRQWANRIVLESKQYPKETCWFVTLTYNDEHLPFKEWINTETGEFGIGQTLVKKDVSSFIKKLRRHYEYHYKHEGIRFYAAGEYGEILERPHYHLCIFNMPIFTELKKYKLNELHQPIWINEEIEKIWGKGFITVARLCWETAAYTARYIMKKQYGKEAEWYYASKGKIPEFTVMSRKPGLAFQYFNENNEKIYQNDEITIPKNNGAVKIKPPKYYDRLYDVIDPKLLKAKKEQRKECMRLAEKAKDKITTLTREERRAINERSKIEKGRKLIRTL